MVLALKHATCASGSECTSTDPTPTSSPSSSSMPLSLSFHTDDLWSLEEFEVKKCVLENLEHDFKTRIPESESASTCSIRERISRFFLSEVLSDVTFVCPQSFTTSSETSSECSSVRLPAHKFVLATGSTVFYAMFYGALPETKEEVLIDDIDSDTFTALLKYLYCDRIDVWDVEQLLHLLYASKKYLLSHLSGLCVDRLCDSIDHHTACLLLDRARLFRECRLIARAHEIIDAQTQASFQSETALMISHDTLESILRRNTLTVSEKYVHELIKRWSESECREINDDEAHPVKPKTRKQRRVLLGNVLQLVRFTTLTLDEFANGPAQDDLLESNEIADIFLHYIAKEKPSLPYCTKPRRGLPVYQCSRFRSSAYRSNQWRYRGRCDSIKFTVNKRIFLTAIGLYGSSNGSHVYGAHIKISRHGATLHEQNSQYSTDGSSSVFTVPIDGMPVEVNSNVAYTISVVIDGTEISYFGQDGRSQIKLECGVNFQFETSPESTNGTGIQGGQIGDIHFVCPSLDSELVPDEFK